MLTTLGENFTERLGGITTKASGLEVGVVRSADGGRPLRGGRATGVSGEAWQAFRRSVEIFSTLFPTWISKTRRDFLSTL